MANLEELRKKLSTNPPTSMLSLSLTQNGGGNGGGGGPSIIQTIAATTTTASTTIMTPAMITTTMPTTATTTMVLPVATTSTTASTTILQSERNFMIPSGSNTLNPYFITGNIGNSNINRSTDLLIGRQNGGHARSISHGGSSSLGSNPIIHPVATIITTVGGRPLRSAMKGHQRAFSHGQIPESSITSSQNAQTRSGHNRVGSKTDFILPPGHKEPVETNNNNNNNNSNNNNNNNNNNNDNRIGGGSTLLAPSSAGTGSSTSGAGSGSVHGHGAGHSRQASRSESIYTLRRAEIPPWWKRLLICKNNKFDENGYRIVVPNHTVPLKTPKREHPNGRRIGNKIRTTKYTLLTFIPKNLLEQFHRVANLYFIFIVLLNWFIDAFGKEVAMIPVLFVLGVTAIKDLFEDRRRRASDKRINNTTCRVYNGESERYKKVVWQDVRVGDLIHLSNNETVPADILLLRSSNGHGVCYIDTCDLDGETNLKSRQVVRGFAEKQHQFQPNKFTSRVEVDAPTTKIYRFHGAMIHPTGERVPISTENLLLRESRLKNTDYVEGLVIYAGHETKAMLNNSGPRYKRSQLEQQMNVDVIWCVIILIILCVIGAVGCKLWLTSFETLTIPFLPFEVNPALESLWTFWTYVIILQVMIPLSLYVTIELCKILQVYHIHNNIDLFDSLNDKRTECRAMNITEELGQIQHIFSDKTGTLTENKMLFRRCTINGIDYNHPKSELEEEFSKPGTLAPPIIVNAKLSEDMCQTTINGGQLFTAQAQRIQEFLLVLAICNTVVVSATHHRDTMNASGVIEIPDESTIGVKIVKPTTEVHNIQHLHHVTNSSSSSSSNCNSISSNININNISSGVVGNNSMGNSIGGGDKYTRLTESRSITPSPPPLIGPSSLSLKHHIPSLSPISSSNESSPSSESPPMKVKGNHNSNSNSIVNNNISPTNRAKSIITAKITTITSILNNKSHNKKITSKLKNSSPRMIELSSDGRPIYEAESPDELALVNAAYSYDCCLLNRGPNHILVSALDNGIIEYEILKVLPFDSHRKCMTTVVRRTGSQDILIYTKGADSSIMSALAPCLPDSEEGMLREKTQQQLDVYARQGLRVLVMAKRVMSALEFVDWWNKHQEIELCMENREKRIRESYMYLENQLTLLGATGIEDRLQDGVPETITALRAAGIAIWVLTGDKPETAINVAYSAKLFQPQMEILRLAARSRNAAESCIAFYLSEIEKQNSTIGLLQRSPKKSRALVVDGKTLTFILDLRSNLTKPFLKLTQYCACVLCCRSTPLQKAFLVKIVKEDLHLRTLAIGDGANDVSMIQMADVGVGISGQEGMQAVMASDFTLARFKYLENLLIIHGFWSYDRLARMILYFFYKNATFVFLIFWYQLYCGFSGSVMIDQMYLMFYNLFFTSLPPLAIGVYDKTIPEDLLLARPYLYRYGRLGLAYKPHSFWITMLDALYQSLIIFFIAEAAYWDSDVGIWEFGTTITTSCLITMLIHGAIEIKSWTILHVMSIVCSLGAYYLFAITYNTFCVKCFGLPSTYWVMHVCLASPIHWFIIILTAIVCIIPRLVFRVLQTSFYPDEATLALLQKKRAEQRGEDLLVTWSRSTSASSIYRTTTDIGLKNQYVATIS